MKEKQLKEKGKDKVDAEKNEKWQKPCPKQPEKAVYTIRGKNPHGFRTRECEIHLN